MLRDLESAPAWLIALRIAVNTSTVRKIAETLGVSASSVSEISNGKYPGRTDKIEAAMRARYPDLVSAAEKTAGKPIWLRELDRQVRATSQALVARKLNVSTTMISQVLAGKYPHPTKRLELLVRGLFLEERWACRMNPYDPERPNSGTTRIDTCQQTVEARELRNVGGPIEYYERGCLRCPHHKLIVDAIRPQKEAKDRGEKGAEYA